MITFKALLSLIAMILIPLLSIACMHTYYTTYIHISKIYRIIAQGV